MLPRLEPPCVNESWLDRLDVFGVALLAVVAVSDLSEAPAGVGDFLGEYHCGRSLDGNVEVDGPPLLPAAAAIFDVADDVDGAGSVRVSKEEIDAMGAIGGGTSGGGCFGGRPG